MPPPLISYKKYGLDLNSISCAPSQPHYIVLGGAHLHCVSALQYLMCLSDGHHFRLATLQVPEKLCTFLVRLSPDVQHTALHLSATFRNPVTSILILMSHLYSFFMIVAT